MPSVRMSSVRYDRFRKLPEPAVDLGRVRGRLPGLCCRQNLSDDQDLCPVPLALIPPR